MAPLLPLAIGAGSSLVSKFIGGPKSSQGPDQQSQEFIDFMRQFGMEGAEQIQGAGPTAENFDMESINRFLNPFLEQEEGRIQERGDFREARAIRDARQRSTLSGSERGSRAAIGESLAGEREARLTNEQLVQLRLQGFGQAGQLALGAQPFRNEALDANQLIRRLEAGAGLLGQTAGPLAAGQVAEGPGPDPLGTGIAAGTIASQFFGGGNEVPFGVGDPLRPGPINVQPPPPGRVPGTDLSPTFGGF